MAEIDQSRYSIIECNGYRKKMHFRGLPNSEQLIDLLISKFNLERSKAKPDSIQLSIAGGHKIGLLEFIKKKMFRQSGKVSVFIESPKPQIPTKKVQLIPLGGFGDSPGKLDKKEYKERSSYPASSPYRETTNKPKMSGELHKRHPTQEQMSLKSSDLASENPHSMVYSHEDYAKIILQEFHLALAAKVLGRMNKVVVIHTTKSFKVMKNIVKLVPLSGMEVPTLIYNKVAEKEDESLELNVNNDICFVIKMNENLVNNLHLFVESLNATNCSELLIKRFIAEEDSSQILCDSPTNEDFVTFIQKLQCNKEGFISAFKINSGKNLSQEGLDILLELCCHFYKYRTAKLIQNSQQKDAKLQV